MTLEQWQEDVKQFGELAYLMYQTKLIYDNPPHDEYEWVDANNNTLIYQALNATGVATRRKESAALPFDLVAAIAGDEFQVIDEWSLDDIKPLVDVETSIINGELCFRQKNYKCSDWFKANSVYAKDLRMKHPRRVGVDYSLFSLAWSIGITPASCRCGLFTV